MTTPPNDWMEAALRVTGHFEDSADPLGAVTGDFDGMGISLGVLQWNIGSGSLQPMVLALNEATVRAAMPTYGADLWRACNTSIPQGLAICRTWQPGGVMKKAAFAELKAFTHGKDFVGRQVAKAATLGASAYDQAKAYAALDPGYGAITKALFCWFFDVLTQNGGLKGLGYADAHAFIAANGAEKADDRVCDWLSARVNTAAAWRDAEANAALWRNAIAPDRLALFVLCYLRAQKSRTEYRGDVLNRKATIALGQGWVHREKHDLRTILA